MPAQEVDDKKIALLVRRIRNKDILLNTYLIIEIGRCLSNIRSTFNIGLLTERTSKHIWLYPNNQSNVIF